jgi:hypothetical protein
MKDDIVTIERRTMKYYDLRTYMISMITTYNEVVGPTDLYDKYDNYDNYDKYDIK